MVVKMETKRKATLVGSQNKEWVVVQGSVGAMIERDSSMNKWSMRNESENSMEWKKETVTSTTSTNEMVTLHSNGLALWCRHAANSDDNVNVGFTVNLLDSGTYQCPNVCLAFMIWFGFLGKKFIPRTTLPNPWVELWCVTAMFIKTKYILEL
jgi:hypothetical protein